MRKSLVLLKNGKNPATPLLPLSKKAPKILVAGTHGHNLGYQCGGWTIEWQGVPGNDLTTGMLFGEFVVIQMIMKFLTCCDPQTYNLYSGNF